MDKITGFEGISFENPPQPYWMAQWKTTDYPVLDKDIKVDVAVVGGGIVGITAAYLLKQENLTVAVIEADKIVQGTTGHTTAKITSQHSLIYSKLIKHLGKEKAQQYADANEYAIAFIEGLINEKQIDCDFSRQDAYVYTHSEKYIKQIQSEVEAASSLGIKAYYEEELPLPFKIKAAERFDNQAQFHPRKYIAALARDIPGDGSYIFEQSRAVDFHEGNPCKVIIEGGQTVTAGKVIIASHFPAYGSSGYYFARMYPERSYVLGLTIKEKFPGGMYITAEDPGRSLRFTPYENGQLVLMGGEHHKTGQGPNTDIHYKNLMKFAKETYEVTGIPYRWSTQDYTTLDDVPYVGNITSKSPDVYVATGFKKWGMTNGTVSAILLKDLIVKGESPWAPVYNPSRFEGDPMIKNFASANFDVVKHLIGDKLKAVSKDMDIKPGEAKIVVHDDEKVGIYKDEKNKIHAVNVTCTHMGCDLAWNTAELSWDCPCHGSRFTYEGDIIEGPALKTLRTDDPLKFNP
ncbi:FAD-dependent oxidoreductase [Candidatus Contubernalis alkaliaceticus]|uniref:FAD-dependent oxidoreductase n=1 Tax=Candidatus Contubernalis alkaliaceticus TaxID=338645 RepID=UPI001F4C0EBB|nr:FAD-dependent oxidoreductase [Candidatus Contubernalis alkalaceticus]UNC91360.1 FAD-dependent oxidoreductase [Candidatus Contubernalis alkalaceticus]